MINSSLCGIPYAPYNQSANLLTSKTGNLNSYPASVTHITEMFTQARKEHLPSECAEHQTPPACGPPLTPSTTLEKPRAFPILKNSHTCGSLFANCGCNNENVRTSVSQICTYTSVPPPSKRLSNPSFCEGYPSTYSSKRSSIPDVGSIAQLKHRSSLKLLPNKASEYLNHPEIPYPIPLYPKEKRRSSDKVTSNLESKHSYNYCYSELTSDKYEYNLEYLKYTAIAYKNAFETDILAQKFLQESGIIGPMGNGVATPIRKNSKNSSNEADQKQQIRRNSKIIDAETRSRNSIVPDDYEYLKTVVAHLKQELSDLEVKYGTMEVELLHRIKELHCRETEVLQLQREIHKLKSVLQQATCFGNEQDILSSLQEEHAMANRAPVRQQSLGSACCTKKQGVSAESSDTSIQPSAMNLTKYEKDFRSKQQIKDAIMDNNFLKHLDSLQVREIIDSMYSKSFDGGSYVIREGEAGAHLYVSAEGDFEVIKDDKVLGRMGPGKAFGELAVLYNCTRTASIRVNGNSRVWVLDRKVFQQIMVRTGLQRLQDNITFLRSVPLLQNLSNDVLAKIADVLEVEFYPAGAYIIRQGASGDTFFIISSGNVKVTQRVPGRLEEDEIRTLQRGAYFGEQALLREECRSASVIALSPGVECLTLDRESFIQLIGDLSEIKEKDYGDEHRVLSRPGSAVSVNENQEYDYIKLDDLDVVGTLGIGGFGRVELVQYTFDKNLTFALKCLKKQHIVDTQQQEHILSEKLVMISCRSSFICRLYRTYRDAKYVYMLLEPCLGGEVWTMLRDRGYFDDHATRFITACVVEAFDYLHNRGIIYRDLKPENLLLDAKGFIKIVDFGFSKRLGYSNKTWTFCGTPEYVAPETILNKGHDRAVDYWALGILMYELLTGSPPFTAADPMKTYNLILKGIDMVDFDNHINIGRSAQSLIKKLCRDMPSERLGYQRGGIQDIKKHRWFQGFDWDGLKAHSISSPIKQLVRGPCDTSNFDCFSKDNDVPPDEFSDWDIDF